MKDEYDVIGKSVPRIDGIEKATGRLTFTTDVELPGMLHAKLLKSPYGHARVKKIDTRVAEQMPGVKAVITFKDTPKTKYNPWLDAPHWVEPRDHLVLTDNPLHNGDAIAAVAAVDEETATEALDAIDIEYEVLPSVFDVLEAMKPGAPQLHEGYPNNVAVTDKKWNEGDVRRGFEEADAIVAGTFNTQNIQHAPMERHCCVAEYDPYLKQITVYAGSQNPFPLMTRMKHVLGLDIPVRVIGKPLGGAFGGNHHLFQHDACATILSMKTRRPVKILLTREEVFQINKRYAMHLECRMGAKKDGKLTAIEGKLIANAGAYSVSTAANMAWPINMIVTLYYFPHLRFEAYGVYTNTNPNTPFRGFGSPQGFFAFEQLIDELAEKIEMDPLEFRMLNAKKVGDIFVATGTKITSSGLVECMKMGAEKMGWHKRPKLDSSGSKKRGMGMACLVHASGCTKMAEGWNESSSAIVHINSDGSVTLNTGAAEIGQGIYTTLAQIVAEEIGVPYESVNIQTKHVDTMTQPWDWGAFGSRSCYIAGLAAQKSAAKAKEGLLSYASEKLEADPQDLEVRRGKVYVKGAPEKSWTVAEVAHFGTELSDHPGQIMGAFTNSPTENPPPFGVQFVEVEVDTETGKVTILKHISVQDVGRAINPTIVEGQIQGALVQGIGFTMSEELKWDDDGRLQTKTYLDYVIPRSTDIPRELQAICVEPHDPTGPFGAKGVGEPAMVPTAAAIANAISHATGVRMRKLPLSPENILKALGKI
jgi:xanthine dehydrogenase molybdenum-binding subunit